MAVDLKIELFSVDLFRNLWFKSRLLEFIPPRMKKYDGQKSENCSEAVHAVWCRQQIFHQSLYKSIWDDYELFSSSGVDFYLYIQNHALQFIPYQLNVFDRLFMTCAFVLEMSCCLAFRANKAYLYLAPITWAMLFDTEMKAEFYFEGGWEIFKKYASSYSASILTHQWMNSVCVHSEDYENVKLLFDSSNKLYNFSEIYKMFTTRYDKRKSKLVMACFKCLPMFLVFRDIVFPGAHGSEKNIFVEGYLQIILRMFSDEEIVLRRNEFLDSLQSTDSSDSDGCVQISNGYQSTNSTSEENCGIQTEDSVEIIHEAFKSLISSELVERLFVEEVECGCGIDPCMFCGRIIGSEDFSNVEKFSVHVERIKSAIAEARHEVAGHRKTSDEKEVMKLFLYLGLEPMQSHTLAVLKKKFHAKQKHKVEKNVENACEALSYFQLQDSSNAKNKSKRKKSVKK